MLRSGYTTGSCMVAATCAAATAMDTGTVLESVELQLPGGGSVTVPIAEARSGFATVIKDGGDDPDVTTGHRIEVRVEPFEGRADPRGYEWEKVVLQAGVGIGIATKPGLSIPVGKWAINPGPRRMLRDNFHPTRRTLVTVSVPDGVELATKTMNPELGIVGGISILGTTGIVHPYSSVAYATGIGLRFRTIVASGGTIAATATGRRTAVAIQRDYPQLGSAGVVEIGDFIQVAIRAATKSGLKKLVIGCMPGKLFKYACGIKNTHADHSRSELGKLKELGVPLPAGLDPAGFKSMGELQATLRPEDFARVLGALRYTALRVLQGWAGNMEIELAVYNVQGERI